jgi:hypothetical protein
MTDTTHADDLHARVDRLRASSAAQGHKAAAPARRHPAKGARIAAAGLSLATTLGLVGVMGYATRSTSTATQPAPTPAPRIVVVVHQNPGTTSTPPGALTASTTDAGATTNASAAAPIALTARPVVSQAPAAQTPIAKTHGSR